MSKEIKTKLYYIMNPGCGWCKKSDPVVEALVSDGYNIITLDVSKPDQAKTAREVTSEHGLQCGTPHFVDAETGNSVCGFREKDVLQKWADGEEMPAPPAPQKLPPNQEKSSGPSKRHVKLEYIWVDGHGTRNVRSKSRYEILNFGTEDTPAGMDEVFTQIPEWSYDGSSTRQADPKNSDLVLRPVRMFGNPLDTTQQLVSYIVLCEVYNADGTPHETNDRYNLRDYLYSVEDDLGLVTSVEQEFMIWDPISDWPSGWGWDNKEDMGLHPAQDGKSYCGVGGGASHRWLADSHVQLCGRAGIRIAGTNAEVLKSQWEFQTSPSDPLTCADTLWVSRFLLQRLAEQRSLDINYDPKPFKEYNGSGGHINFSTQSMREDGGEVMFQSIIDALEENHDKVMDSYGEDNKKRLTGKHETSKYNKFTSGSSDRTASVRIPLSTTRNWRGHIEDRRPAANMDPYAALLSLTKVVSNAHAGVLA